MRDFLVELRRRNVIRVAVAYLALAWLVLQVAGLVIPAFGIPAWVLRLLFIVVGLGFPIALVISWVYELTPDGLRRESEVPPSASITRLTGRKLDYIIIGVLAAVVGLLLLDRLVLAPRTTVSTATTTATASDTAAVAAPARASIAVLPFADMSQAKDQEYFSDGLSEELLNLLARIPQLHVAGRTSSFSFKGKSDDLKTIGQKLGVATILEGSVRKAGDRLRITAQLINAADGFHLWTETYDRQLTDVFAMQDEIAAAVVSALKVKLLPQQQSVGARGRTVSPEAYNHYLLGLHLLRNPGRQGTFRRASEAFGKAIAVDPEYAAALAGYAVALGYATYSPENPQQAAAAAQERREAVAAAERAVALDPMLADGYSARGHLRRIIDWNWTGALADLEQAIALNPADFDTQLRYGQLLSSLDRVPETVAANRRMTELDPLSASAWSTLGLNLAQDGKLEEARAALHRALQIEPDSAWNNYWLGVTEMRAGRPDVAMQAFEHDDDQPPLDGVAIAAHALGDEARSQRALQELKEKFADKYAFQIAGVHAQRGEIDEAFTWLERARAQHELAMMYVKVAVFIEPVHGDPRYAALLQKMGLPP